MAFSTLIELMDLLNKYDIDLSWKVLQVHTLIRVGTRGIYSHDLVHLSSCYGLGRFAEINIYCTYSTAPNEA